MKWSTETKVGAFAFVGIILFSGMMFELSSMVLFGKKGFEVTGCFTEAEGIEPGNPIHYVGVEVGRVDKVAVKNGEAVLTLRFYDGSEVPVDAEFSVQESSIMGGKYIKVNGGHLNNGILKSGAVIHGDGGNTINTAMNKLDKLIDTAQIMVNGINAIVADPNSQGSVKSTLRNVDLMTQNLAFLTEQGIAIANEVDTMAAQMNSLLYQFNGDGKAVEDARAILDNLAVTSANARNLSGQAQQVSGKLSSFTSKDHLDVQGTLLYNTKNSEFSPDFNIRIGGDTFMRLGVESLGNGSLVDAVVGNKKSKFDFYGGIIRSKFGGGVSYKNKDWNFNADIYDPNNLTLRLRGGRVISSNVYVIGQSIFPHSREGGGEYFGIGYMY